MKVASNTEIVTTLLNGTLRSLNSVISQDHNVLKPRILDDLLHLNYGVLVGITGDLKGKLVLSGDPSIFASIGKSMFGTYLQGEMLISFSGELGNMIAGGLSTNISNEGINVNITAPTILQGDTTISGYKKALILPVVIDNLGNLSIYLLMD
ncbi:chemotaxis protein CheX [Bacillaceae bacterium W0354]